MKTHPATSEEIRDLVSRARRSHPNIDADLGERLIAHGATANEARYVLIDQMNEHPMNAIKLTLVTGGNRETAL